VSAVARLRQEVIETDMTLLERRSLEEHETENDGLTACDRSGHRSRTKVRKNSDTTFLSLSSRPQPSDGDRRGGGKTAGGLFLGAPRPRGIRLSAAFATHYETVLALKPCSML